MYPALYRGVGNNQAVSDTALVCVTALFLVPALCLCLLAVLDFISTRYGGDLLCERAECLLNEHVGGGLPLKDVAKKLGVSTEYASAIVRVMSTTGPL